MSRVSGEKILNKTDYWLLFTRISGILLIFLSIAQFALFFEGRNDQYPLISFLFLFAILSTIFSTIISVLNSWFYKEPKLYEVVTGREPKVGVIIPTHGEPTNMVVKTVGSVLEQNWPKDKLYIVVSDDNRNSDLEAYIKQVHNTFPNVLYHIPHPKGSLNRLGEGKAGNLNSALISLLDKDPNIRFIETRDADDLVGTKDFLRLVIGTMLKDKSVSFVQTIKRTAANSGDPFLNEERLWYERSMHYRASVNAHFPCGSGLVWRTIDLLKIKGFPSWNLVEDLHSGYKVLKSGGKGEYLPIVGAVAQSAPEDIPNYYKQRGTWAIDAMRLFLWENSIFARNLNVWQILQFFELGFSYSLSLVMLVFIFSITSCLGYSICPTNNNSSLMFITSLMFIVIMEIYNLARARGMSYSEVWKVRQTWIGLLHVFAISVFKALIYGPNKKPTYKVTRKYRQAGFYWKEVLPQIFFVSILIFAVVKKLFDDSIFQVTDIILIFWSLFLIIGFSRVIRLSFHGVDLKRILRANIKVKFLFNPKIPRNRNENTGDFSA